MPTFDTANSSGTYQLPSGLDEVKLVMVAGVGETGEDGGFETAPGQGGDAAKLVLTYNPADDAVLTYSVGENAGSPEPHDKGQSPYADGGDGRDYAYDGGGGGGASAVESDINGLIGVAGAGGGGGGVGNATYDQPPGGGGGGPGGLGGSDTGADAEGSGPGGDGGDGAVSSDAQDGQDGGTSAIGSATVLESSTLSAPTPRVEIIDTPRNVTLTVTGHTDTSVTLEFGADNAESWTLHRSTTSGFTPDSGNQIASYSSGATLEYIDTGLTQGTQYYYVAVASNPAGDTNSTERGQLTDAPAPTLDSFTNVDDDGDGTADELSYAWTRGGTDEVAYQVLYSTDGGSTFTQANGDLSGAATSYTTGEQADGTDHVGKVVAVYNDVTRESGTLTTTTELPALTTNDISPLDASTEDQLGVPQPGHIDTGEYRVEYRETGTSTWQLAGTLAFDDADGLNITGLLDGEKYDVQVRPQTADVTGSYVSVSEVTLLPADANFQNTDRVA